MTLKSFEEYLNNGTVRKVKPDNERSKSLISQAERKLRSLNTNLEKVGITEDNTNDHLEYCYDTLMLLIRAILHRKGYSCSGFGAHEAEIAYLRILEFNEQEVQFADKLRSFRNGLLYYGDSIDKEYCEKIIDFTRKTFPRLRKLLD